MKDESACNIKALMWISMVIVVLSSYFLYKANWETGRERDMVQEVLAEELMPELTRQQEQATAQGWQQGRRSMFEQELKLGVGWGANPEPSTPSDGSSLVAGSASVVYSVHLSSRKGAGMKNLRITRVERGVYSRMTWNWSWGQQTMGNRNSNILMYSRTLCSNACRCLWWSISCRLVFLPIFCGIAPACIGYSLLYWILFNRFKYSSPLYSDCTMYHVKSINIWIHCNYHQENILKETLSAVSAPTPAT